MKRSIILGIMIILLASSGIVLAQAAKVPVVRVASFSGNALTPGELSTLERLVSSFIVELKLFRVMDNTGKELALTETENALAMGSSVGIGAALVADYIVSGSVGKVGDLFIFTLDNTKVSTSEKISVSETANTINDIVLKVKPLTRNLFGRPDIPAASSGTPAATGRPDTGQTGADQFKPAVKLVDLVGTWQGDKGLESVRIFADGTGVAVLSGGGTMKIKISVTDSTVTVQQNQPNDPRMYRTEKISQSMAVRIAAKARPMRWIFRLTLDAVLLSGTKETIAASGSGDSIQIDNSFTRDAQWKRIAR